MDLEKIQNKSVAILGYGNQGRAHALNLRDSGVQVIVGARPGKQAWTAAESDGFTPVEFSNAADQADVVMFLLPDQSIASAFGDLLPAFEEKPKWIGFAHGFAYQFGGVPRLPQCQYFLVAPKGAGAMLRERFLNGRGLPTTYAVAPGSTESTRHLARSYAETVAGKTSFVRETTFEMETEGDLFGEQVVLVGGLMELMHSAFQTLIKNGHSPEMAFFDVCQEVQVTVDLFLKYGPAGMAEKISPTALYGALTRGPRIITEQSRQTMQEIFDEVRSGEFARELLEETRKGSERMKQGKKDLATSGWEEAYQSVKSHFS